MRPRVLVGIAVMLFGVVVLALRGISYTKERQEVEVGPLEVAAERKGFIPPVVGVVALVVGAGVLLTARRRPD